ncbi:MAG: glycosyltransferase family 2 protein [Candidatus Woesebacteria bacterium]|jgi:glycosyltransferase involved in cell wall biosynthesis
MNRGRGKGVCVIIPAYNEAKVIGSVLDSLPRYVVVRKNKVSITAVVVNDGSVDSTYNVVARRNHVVIVDHILNSGAGGATRTGLRYAKDNGYDYVITMDADGQHAVDDVIKLARAIVKDEADFIIGSRLLKRQEGMVWYRIIGNYGLNIITFMLFGVLVTDSQSGLKAINRQALEKMTFHSSSYAFCSEMIWMAHRSGLRLKELPIKAIYSDYSLGKGQSNWNGLPLVWELIKRRVIGLING